MGQVFMLIVGAVLLFSAGTGLGYWLAAMGRERSRADALQQELDAYRGRVNRHFSKTAEHFQTIGREYRALYDHMASGAEALCDTRETGQRLSFAPAPTAEEAPAGASAGEGARKDGAGDGGQDSRSDAAAAAAVENAADAAPPAEPAGPDDTLDTDADAAPEDAGVDDTPPDSRVRGSGGESAPADAESGSGSARAAASKDLEKPESAAVDDTPSGAGKGERIYH